MSDHEAEGKRAIHSVLAFARFHSSESTIRSLWGGHSSAMMPSSDAQSTKRDLQKSLWVDDRSATACGICGTPFTLFRRRHHCRSCGLLFCATCCGTKKTLRQHGYDKPVRICDICAKDAISDREQVHYENAPLAHQNLIGDWLALCKTGNTDEMKKKIMFGVPDSVRSVVWTSLADVNTLVEKNPNVYELFKSRPNPQFEIAILLDIPRTFPEHDRFGINGTDTNLLSNVLTAFASFDQDIGYVQGMSFIAAVLLMHMNEETSFWMLVQILRQYDLQPFFQQGVYPTILNKFSDQFRESLPDLDAYLTSQGCQPSLFAFQWIRTLFALDFELSVAFRLWDIFFVEGLDFVLQFILTMFYVKQQQIKALDSGQMLIYIKNLPKQFTGSWSDLISLTLRMMHKRRRGEAVVLSRSTKQQKKKGGTRGEQVVQGGFTKDPSSASSSAPRTKPPS